LTTPETCDDGNIVAGDGCAADCLSGLCPALTSLSVGTDCYECGDGLVQTPTEQCDDSNISPADGCGATCLIEPGYVCDNSTTQATNASLSVCALSCGDGLKYWDHYSEICDDGNLVDGDGCSSTCQIESLYQCDLSTTNATEGALSVCSLCGNGVKKLSDGEQCDDGNLTPGDGCSATC